MAVTAAADIKGYRELATFMKYQPTADMIASGDFVPTWDEKELIDKLIYDTPDHGAAIIDIDVATILTQEERAMVQCLYGDGGEDGIARVKEFLGDYSDLFAKKVGERAANEFYDFLTTKYEFTEGDGIRNAFKGFANSMKDVGGLPITFGKGFFDGTGNYIEALGDVITPDSHPTAAEYAQTALIQKFTSTEGKTAEQIVRDGAYFTSYSIGTGLGEKAIPIAAGLIGGPKVTMILSTATSFGKTVDGEVQKGASFVDAYKTAGILKLGPTVIKAGLDYLNVPKAFGIRDGALDLVASSLDSEYVKGTAFDYGASAKNLVESIGTDSIKGALKDFVDKTFEPLVKNNVGLKTVYNVVNNNAASGLVGGIKTNFGIGSGSTDAVKRSTFVDLGELSGAISKDGAAKYTASIGSDFYTGESKFIDTDPLKSISGMAVDSVSGYAQDKLTDYIEEQKS